ncbi:alpha/beta fold hydrolase [Silvimonas sp.]|uniref:alpha/beta hydrolase n=1 Tax=Silvimonas sp. TaxID=2650811 RepID=UPI00283E5CEE|nr:alpha/beta fold hydrolase [Silvimonas sp.]MDR3428872.1 alpha/beta fold hydrolase [Silvimonas sp.]
MNQADAKVISAKNSTTGRSYEPPAPKWLKTGLRTLDVVMPRTAASVLQRLFTTPPRPALRPDEAAVLAQARRWQGRVRGMAMSGYEWGNPDDPAVLLIHGWGGHAGHMSGMVEPLLAAGYRVLAVDVPGHGDSPPGQVALPHFHEAIEEMASRAGRDSVQGLIAHSFGAAAATYGLSRGLQIPRVVFVGPMTQFGALWAAVQARTGVSQRLVQRMISRMEARFCLGFDEIEPVVLAGQLQTPLLVLHDLHDDKVAIGQGEALVANWRGAALRTSSQLGHLKILKDQASVAAAVGFLQRA